MEACRELFTELEFTSMLRDLEPAAGGMAVELIEEPTEEQAAGFYAARAAQGFAFALDAAAPDVEEAEEEAQQTMSLLDAVEAAEKKASFSVGVCADGATALRLTLTAQLRALLEDAAVPKRVHDWKTALHPADGAGRNAARTCGRHDAAVVCAESDACHAGTGGCGGAARAACAVHADGGSGGDSRAGSGAEERGGKVRSAAGVQRDRPAAGAGAVQDGAGRRADRYRRAGWTVKAICDRTGAGGRADL